jgi:hypothetical protein
MIMRMCLRRPTTGSATVRDQATVGVLLRRPVGEAVLPHHRMRRAHRHLVAQQPRAAPVRQVHEEVIHPQMFYFSFLFRLVRCSEQKKG